MKSYCVIFIHKQIKRYSVDAENPQDAMERVLAGEGIEGNDDYPEPEIHVREREG